MTSLSVVVALVDVTYILCALKRNKERTVFFVNSREFSNILPAILIAVKVVLYEEKDGSVLFGSVEGKDEVILYLHLAEILGPLNLLDLVFRCGRIGGDH